MASLWTAVFVAAFGTNVPTPLLLIYRDELGLTPNALTGAFGVYAAGLVPALLLAGPASDRLGRRPVVVGTLLVLVATWLRAAAGSDGLREVSRRALGRLRRVPAAPEAAQVLDGISSEGRLAAAGRTLAADLRAVPMRPVPVLDAVLGWVVREAAAFRPPPAPPAVALAARPLDWLLVLLAAALALALALAA